MKVELQNIQKLRQQETGPKHLVTINIKYKKYWSKTSLKQKGIGDLFLCHVLKRKPKNFLEMGVFHGVTSRNVCDLLSNIHGNNFKFTGIDIFSTDTIGTKEEFIPKTKFIKSIKNNLLQLY